MQFYAAVKAYNRLTRFVMITGKHPFQQEQLTGEMNHLFDISEHWKYPAICGYTSEELKRYLEEWIQTVKAPEQATEDIIAEMEKWYGGYCFHEQSGIDRRLRWTCRSICLLPENRTSRRHSAAHPKTAAEDGGSDPRQSV